MSTTVTFALLPQRSSKYSPRLSRSTFTLNPVPGIGLITARAPSFSNLFSIALPINVLLLGLSSVQHITSFRRLHNQHGSPSFLKRSSNLFRIAFRGLHNLVPVGQSNRSAANNGIASHIQRVVLCGT